MLNKTLISFVILLNSISIYSQSNEASLDIIRSEVENINKQILYRSTITNDIYKDNSVSPFNIEEISGDLTYIYFDESSVIRKSIHAYNYPEYRGITIHYYGLRKDVIYTINREWSALNPAVIGIVAKNKKKSVYTDIQFNDDNDNLILVKEFWGEDNLDTGNLVFGIKDVCDLENYCSMVFSVNDIYSDSMTKMKVLFVPPGKGEQSLVNVRLVNLRASCSFNSDVYKKAGLGTDNYILNILERPKLVDGVYWSKVKTDKMESHVFSRFLEPVEKIIK